MTGDCWPPGLLIRSVISNLGYQNGGPQLAGPGAWQQQTHE